METKSKVLTLLAGMFIGVPLGFAQELYVATLRPGKVVAADVPANLSQALIATLDSGGVLKGSDSTGRPILAVPEAMVAKLKASKAVTNVAAAEKMAWKPVTKLRLSYLDKVKPSQQDLANMSLKLVEDYTKGSFMIVEPLNGVIDSKLAKTIADNPKINYAVPSFQIQAVKPKSSRSNVNGLKAIPKPKIAAVANPMDKLYPMLWGMQSIRAPEAWRTSNQSPDVVVAVIDTGVDYKHPDLSANMWKHPVIGNFGYDFVQNDNDPMDGDSHGTHCAGTVGAVMDANGVVGVTWKVKIMACRWLDDDGYGDVADAIKCIDYAIENGAEILSNSWFWEKEDESLEFAIKRAKAKNVMFVAAASNFRKRPGNNGGDNDKVDTLGRYPSAYPIPNVLAVAAIDSGEQLATFSNWGKKTVHIGAPGVAVVSSVLRGTGSPLIDPNKDYDSFDGTSMATPHVAGAAALALAHLRATNPAATSLDVRKLILDNARQIPSLAGKCTTGGTLDLSFVK